MSGVTAAIVGFIFVCIVIPSLVKHKNHYYVGLICVLAIIFLDAMAHMFPETAGSLKAVFYVLTAFVQIIAILMLVQATGGLTFNELKDDMIEVLRRGETEKEIIIPLSEETKQKMKAAQEAAKHPAARVETEPKTYTIDDPGTKPPAAPPATPPPVQSGSLPLD